MDEVDDWKVAVKALEPLIPPKKPAMPVQLLEKNWLANALWATPSVEAQEEFDELYSGPEANGVHLDSVMAPKPLANHNDKIGSRGYASSEFFAMVHTPIPIPQANRIPAAKKAVQAEFDKLNSKPGGTWDFTTAREISCTS